jgi:SpoVK/Ycf46/Vps4 family AAA+-type ATPase
MSMNSNTLPDSTQAQLQALCDHIRQQERAPASERLGQPAPGSRSTALFAGGSRESRTTAAEFVARTLGRDLYRIDLRELVSKYIGETEKNLRRLFDDAQRSGALLLLDEADALFGARADTKDAHDRYAEPDTSSLLQAIEAHAGVAVLATNNSDAFDETFTRSMACVICFDAD